MKMLMKKFFFLLLAFGFTSFPLLSQIKWESVKSTYEYIVTPTCSAISFDGTLYVTAVNNIIYKSVDKGKSWRPVPQLAIDKYNKVNILKTDNYGDLFGIFAGTYSYMVNILEEGKSEWITAGSGLQSPRCYHISDVGDLYLVQLYSALKFPRTNYHSIETMKGFFGRNINSILTNNFQRVFIFTTAGLYANLDSIGQFTLINDSLTNVQKSCSDSSGTIFIVDSVSKIRYSSDFGHTWILSNGNSFTNVTDFFCDVNGRLYLLQSSNVYFSDDKGVTFSRVKMPDSSDTKILSFSVNVKNEILVNTDKNLYYSGDNGKTYEKLIIKSPIENITKFVVSGDGIILALKSGSLFQSTDSMKNITPMLDPGSGNEILCLAINDSNDIYLSKANQGLFLKTHRGTKWNLIIGGLDYDIKCLVPVNYDLVLAGTINGGIYYSNDGGLGWSKSKMDTGTITVPAIVKLNGSDYLASSYDYGIHTSSDNGYRWQIISHDLNGKSVNSMIYNKGAVYAATDTDGIFKSIDGGTSWQRITFFPEKTHLFNLVSLVSGGIVVLKDTSGVFYSRDGEDWLESNDGLLSKNTTCLTSDETGFVYVSTLKNGIYKSSEKTVSVDESNSFPSFLTVFPNPTEDIIKISFTGKGISANRVVIFNLLGEKIFEEKTMNEEMNISMVNLTKGLYFLKIVNDSGFTYKKIIKN